MSCTRNCEVNREIAHNDILPIWQRQEQLQLVRDQMGVNATNHPSTVQHGHGALNAQQHSYVQTVLRYCTTGHIASIELKHIIFEHEIKT